MATVLCPMHNQSLEIETDSKDPNVKFAICVCEVPRNLYAGKVVWTDIGDPNKLTTKKVEVVWEEVPVENKKNKKEK